MGFQKFNLNIFFKGRNFIMLGYYNYTVILTYLSMLISFTGITYACNGNLHAALICLMISGLCDMFDGKIASTKTDRSDKERRFGIQIDSLSDLICFGVLPATIIYTLCEGSNSSFYVSGLYVLSALIRLAYFNVDEEERQNHSNETREIYYGLPVTSAALLIPAFFGLAHIVSWPIATIGQIVLLIMSIAFLMPFQLKKPQLFGKISLIIVGGLEFVMLFIGG